MAGSAATRPFAPHEKPAGNSIRSHEAVFAVVGFAAFDGRQKSLPGIRKILAVDRVRSTKAGEAISLEYSRLPWRKGFADVLRQGLIDGSLQQTLVALDIRPIGGSEAVALARLSASEAVLLGRSEGDARREGSYQHRRAGHRRKHPDENRIAREERL